MTDTTSAPSPNASKVESTLAAYNKHGQPSSTVTSDGQTTCLRYYSGADTDKGTRGDQLPAVSKLISGLKLADETLLADAAALVCPKIVDPHQPPLMARLEYLAFDGTATSAATLTLCGYAKSTHDAQGRLMPDTVLVLEGVTVASVKSEAKDWTVSLATSWSGIKVTLIQSQANKVSGALRSITRTATTWYKDNTVRSTQTITETTYPGKQLNTWKLVTTAPLIAGGDAILSQQIQSALSGRLLRESHQDGDGKPVRFSCHDYDTRGRGAHSVTYPYDANAFDSGEVKALKPIEQQRITHTETGSGTWLTTLNADGRQQRTLYDGLQRAVRREMQREASDTSEFVLLEESTWGRGEAPERVKAYDFLPGGLCTHNDKDLQAPTQLHQHFWQAHADPVLKKNAKDEQTLTQQSALALLPDGIQHTRRQQQVNHATGSVTLSSALWSGHDSSDEAKALRVEELIDARGRNVALKQHVPMEDGTVKSREWTTTWDDLDRPLSRTQPDESVVTWNYQGMSAVPTTVSIKAKGKTSQLLGNQTLEGGGNQGDLVTGLVVGGKKGLAYSDRAGKLTGPDGKKLYRKETDHSVEWYVENKSDSTGTLLASFKFNQLTQSLKAERPAQGTQQSKVTSEDLTPLLLGAWHFNRTVHAQQQRQEALVSLRGQVQRAKYANGVSSRAWSGPQGQCDRVVRGSLEYWYEYTALGQCQRMTVRDLNTGRTMAVSYTYDKLGNEVERLYRLDDQTKTRYVQTWSSIGQLTSKVLFRDGQSTPARTETFIYYTSVDGTRDELQKWTVEAISGDEVKDAEGHAIKEQSYQYDALGNLTECSSTRSNGDVERVTYEYDSDHPTRRTRQSTQLTPKGGKAGALRSLSYTYDDAGRLTLNEREQTLAYSDTGRLRSVTEKNQDTPSSYYEYDENDCLVSQWISTAEQRRVLAYTDDVLCGETWLDTKGKVTRTLTLDEHAGMVIKHCQGATETQLFILGDPQQAGGDEYWVDAKGAWQHRSLAFTPWGEAPVSSTQAMLSGLGRDGQRLDPATGCAHLGNGYRVYDPRHRAFYQRDGWSPFGAGGLNDRAYCAGGDPVNWHDPSGHIMLSRRDQAQSLARLDSAISATQPPVHEAVPWWQWVALAVFVVVAIAATILTLGAAGPVMAGIGMALCTAIMVGAAVTAAGMAQRQSNPRLSSRLEGAGHVVMALASLPGMAGGLSVMVAAALVVTTMVSVALDVTKMAVEQDNPELAEKLGWASMASQAVAALTTLPSLVKSAGKSLQRLRSLRYSVASEQIAVMPKGKSELLRGSISKAQRDAINSTRPATPPSTPIRSGIVRGTYPVQEQDIGDFIVFRRSGNSSDTAIVHAHGGNAIRGGKVSIPENSLYNHYAPQSGTLITETIRTTIKHKFLGITYRTTKGPITTDFGLITAASKIKLATPTKSVPGGHFTSNYVLSHFEYNNNQLRHLVGKYAVDIIVPKETIESTTLHRLFTQLDTANLNYKVFEGMHCRASELKATLFFPLPKLPITIP
ncbi:RHS repeat-associated core domain-containing protein [Pseudomonas sp. REB1044]|uniref:RHS repeat-associated core domain-containing protein n=1 Tax=Pseudomonas sp. REB1044 TaxID=2675224 RepID=UPI00315D1DE9